MTHMRDYLCFEVKGELALEVKAYFEQYGCRGTYEHTMDVLEELQHMKECCGSIEAGSIAACYCHDLGRVVAGDDILDFCSMNRIPVTNEEKVMPSILHQKISAFLATEVFGIDDLHILNAIRYHTTLRKAPEPIEMEVFLADKMSWKEEGYRELAWKVKEALKISKENAVMCYLNDQHEKRNSLKLYHLDAYEAYLYYKEQK